MRSPFGMHRARPSQIVALAAATLMAAGFAPSSGASAKGLKTIYAFCHEAGCPDGADPDAPLSMDAAGNLYGTTASFGANGNGGTVFELIPQAHGNWKFKLLYSFCALADCADGNDSEAGLVIDTSGNLYGSTAFGGAHGYGVAYELMPNANRSKWKFKILHDFCSKNNCADGASPQSALTYAGAQSGALYDGTSPLYGMTPGGGNAQGDMEPQGTVFTLTPRAGTNKWDETVLYDFCSINQGGFICIDGARPLGGLIVDAFGNLYGMTSQGGHGTNLKHQLQYGTIFELSPGASWTETVLHSFCSDANCADGEYPQGALLADAHSDLFGMAPVGGTPCTPDSGCYGVAFDLSLNGVNSVESVLYNFCSQLDCADGATPLPAPVMDAAGHLFATTENKGNTSIVPYGGGTLFQVRGSSFKTLYRFCSQPACADGQNPDVGVIMDGAGNLFGTTSAGGDTGVYSTGGGTLYEWVP